MNRVLHQSSTKLLRGAIVLLGVVVLTLCFLAIPAVYQGWALEYPQLAYLTYPILFEICATAVPFFIALSQAWKLLGLVDRSQAFSGQSVLGLKRIKYCGLAIGGLYALGLPMIYAWARHVDAPGLMGIGLIIMFAAFVVAVFAAVLQKLLQSAIKIKSENDLTV